MQTALARLYVAWPRVRRSGTESAYAWRIVVNAHIDEVRRPRWRRQQPAGYRVAEMPAGWVVQGGNAYALTIAPQNATNADPDVFIGKIVVMLQSADATVPPTQGAVVPVSSRPGRLTVQDHTQMLVYQDAFGHWVVIQVPTSLGWDDAQLARFAAGVQVLHNAQPGHG